MSNILVNELTYAHDKEDQLEMFTLSDFKIITTLRYDSASEEKFDDFPKDFKKEKKPSVPSKVATIDATNDNNYSLNDMEDKNFNKILDDYSTLIGNKKQNDNKDMKFIDSESPSNGIYRVRVEMGGNKTMDFIVKALKKGNEILFHNDISNDKIDDKTQIICRVGNNDEIILKENIRKINEKYLF